MKKQIKICLAFCAGALIANFAGGFGYAETKKDVSDPVLNEIIQNFDSKMPRFINKHGKDVFVADAPVTRGSLMLALYEYDKSLRIPRKDAASKQEIEELSARLNALESGSANRPRKQEESEKASLDITEIINDLMPNMPVLLDNSLNNSKVFSGLRQEISNLKSQDGGQFAANLDQTRDELQALTKKVDAMEQSAPVYTGGNPGQVSQYIKKDLELTRTQLAKLERRISRIENTNESGTGSTTRSSSEDAKSNTSVMAKISMGLSMVAALFIAR
jgi:BMFP domain-containing protein YqiC